MGIDEFLRLSCKLLIIKLLQLTSGDAVFLGRRGSVLEWAFSHTGIGEMTHGETLAACGQRIGSKLEI